MSAPVHLAVQSLDKADRVAIKALAKGEASPAEQVLALSVILKKLSRAYDLTYVPQSFDASAFLAGRAFVGMQINKIITLPAEDKNPK